MVSKRKKLTQERLKELLNYDPETGIFTWRQNRGGLARKGSVAGRVNDNGYRTILVDGKRYKAARLAWFYIEGYFPEHDVDHEDKERDNNAWKNLRHLSRSCNLKNTNIRSSNTSGITGVRWDTDLNKWRVQIQSDGKNYHRGVFNKKTDAALARVDAEKEFGFNTCCKKSSAALFLQDAGVL